MKYHIRHQFRNLRNYYVTTFFDTLFHRLQNHYSNHTFDIVNDDSYENRGYGSIYSCMNFSIINPENEKYILISFFDNWKYHFMKHLGWNPSKMMKFFYPGGFNYLDYFHFQKVEKDNIDIDCPSDIEHRYSPIFYGPYETNSLELISQIYDNTDINSTLKQLYFRGYMWDFRSKMTAGIHDDTILIVDKNQNNNNLTYESYLLDLSKYRCALSLPGGTEVCNRDIECFAVGVPVLRPYLDIQYPDPLISNYHYINIYKDCKYWDGNPSYLSYEDFVNHLLDIWYKVQNNIEYLEFIRYNARQWFIKNCTLDNNIEYLLKQINLEELNG